MWVCAAYDVIRAKARIVTNYSNYWTMNCDAATTTTTAGVARTFTFYTWTLLRCYLVRRRGRNAYDNAVLSLCAGTKPTVIWCTFFRFNWNAVIARALICYIRNKLGAYKIWAVDWTFINKMLAAMCFVRHRHMVCM